MVCSIFHAPAMRLIQQAEILYARDAQDIDLDVTVKMLDYTTIYLCLGLLDWAPLLTTKAPVMLLELLLQCDSITALIHIIDSKLQEFNVLDFPPLKLDASSYLSPEFRSNQYYYVQ